MNRTYAGWLKLAKRGTVRTDAAGRWLCPRPPTRAEQEKMKDWFFVLNDRVRISLEGEAALNEYWADREIKLHDG